MRPQTWTDGEVEYLIESYKNHKIRIADIAKTIGKSESTVMKKAKELGIKKTTIKDIPVPVGFKMCRHCNNIKLLKDFYVKTNSSDGHYPNCRVCSSMLTKERRNKKILEEIQRQVDEQDNKERQLREDYIKECQGKLFRCSACKEEFSIENFGLVKKYGKITRKVFCRKCYAKKTEENTLKNLRTKGYR